MEKNDLLVLLLTYNNQDTLKDTLDDLASQTFKNFKLVIIDDCSRDKTVEIINGFKNKFQSLDVVVNSHNKGAIKNLKDSFSLVSNLLDKYEYFHWMCPDDNYNEKYFEKILAEFKMRDVVTIQTYVRIVFTKLNTSKIAKCPSLLPDENSLEIFNDYSVDGEYQPYNQFIHGVSRSKYIKKIYHFKKYYFLFESVLINELFIVALMKLFGGIYTIPDVLFTRNIGDSFEKKNPNDKFTIIRTSLLRILWLNTVLIFYAFLNWKFIFDIEFYKSIWGAMRLYFYQKFIMRLSER